MLKKAKINVMVIIGMMVAVGTVAFTAPTTSKFTDVQWHRILNSQDQFEWKLGSPSTLCEPSDDICSVTLPSGLDPENMTTQQIKDAAVDGEFSLGYTEE